MLLKSNGRLRNHYYELFSGNFFNTIFYSSQTYIHPGDVFQASQPFVCSYFSTQTANLLLKKIICGVAGA